MSITECAETENKTRSTIIHRLSYHHIIIVYIIDVYNNNMMI